MATTMLEVTNHYGTRSYPAREAIFLYVKNINFYSSISHNGKELDVFSIKMTLRLYVNEFLMRVNDPRTSWRHRHSPAAPVALAQLGEYFLWGKAVTDRNIVINNIDYQVVDYDTAVMYRMADIPIIALPEIPGWEMFMVEMEKFHGVWCGD